MTRLLLAIDIGTTNSKGALITDQGEIISSCSYKHGVSRPCPGWAEHDANKIWWTELVKICNKLLKTEGIQATDIVSVGISTLTPAVLPLDKNGSPLRPAMLYSLDTRADQEIRQLNEILGETYPLKENLRPIVHKSPAPKILWLKNHEREIFDKTAYFVGAPTYLVYKLTGQMVADYGCYKLAGLPFSLRQFGWDVPSCQAIGIRAEQLPKLKWATELAGTITKEAAEMTGLAAGTAVAVGTGDYLADSLSYGTRFAGIPQISYGSCIGVNNGNDPAAILFPDYETDWEMEKVPGGSMSNGCATIDWMVSLISGYNAQRIDNTELERLAKETPAGANGIVMLPYFNGEKIPFTNPNASGLLFGLRMSHTHSDIYKACLESIGYSVRHLLELKDSNNSRQAFVVGGGIKIPQLLQTVSNITGYIQTPLESIDGALLGNAFIAGVACKIFEKRDDINAWVRTGESILPDAPLRVIYDQGFEKYLKLYQANKHLMVI